MSAFANGALSKWITIVLGLITVWELAITRCVPGSAERKGHCLTIHFPHIWTFPATKTPNLWPCSHWKIKTSHTTHTTHPVLPTFHFLHLPLLQLLFPFPNLPFLPLHWSLKLSSWTPLCWPSHWSTTIGRADGWSTFIWPIHALHDGRSVGCCHDKFDTHWPIERGKSSS